MKFLFATDPHATTKGPGSRTDDYSQAVKNKLSELAAVAQVLQVQGLFIGGDLFDKPVVSEALKGDIAAIIRSSGVPWYVVPGNHDLFGYNIATLPNTSLGLLWKAGVINILDRQAGPVVFAENWFKKTGQEPVPVGPTISFEGQEYHREIDKRDPGLDYYVTSTSEMKVLIPHSMLLDKPYFPDVPHTLVSDLEGKTDADLILGTHYHDGFPETSVGGITGPVTVRNIGSMLRDEASKGNIKRMPQYAILEFHGCEQGGLPNYTLTVNQFKCAAKGKDIFDRSHIDDKRAKEYYLTSFEQKISDDALSAVDVRSVLDVSVMQDKTIPQDVSQDAHEWLTTAETMLNDVASTMAGYIEKPDNIWIEEIAIKGFQSHEDTTVSFGPGLNAIVGPSDSGKSAVIRALRYVLYNEPKGAEFIRQGCGSVSVQVRFSDGVAIERARTGKSSGTYVISNDTDGERTYQGFANNVPVDIVNAHQMPYLRLAKDLETTLNIGNQLEGPFLISESPGTRAAMIGKLTGVDLVDTAMREINKKSLDTGKDIKSWEEQLEETEKELDDYADLADAKRYIDKVQQQLTDIESQNKELAELQRLDNGLKQAIADESSLIDPLAQCDIILSKQGLVDELDRLYNEMKELIDIQTEYAKCEKAERDLEHKLSNLTHIPVDTQFLDGLAASISKHKSLMELADGMTDNRMLVHDLRKRVRTAQRAEEEALKLYQDILEEAGHCPTCQQPISKGAHVHV